MRILQWLAGNRATSREAVYEIARREAAGKATQKDADALRGLLDGADMTEEEYGAAVALCQQHSAAQKAGAARVLTTEATIKAREAIHAEEMRFAQARKDHEAARNELQQALADRAREAAAALRQAREAESLEVEHPKILGVEPRNLDHFTLVYGEDLINRNDPDADVLGVSWETYTREVVRRDRIWQRAGKRAHALWQAEYHQWEARHPRSYPNVINPTEPFRPFEPPTWAQIVERGWSVELDYPEEHAA